ncbi:MAG: sodium:proton antiporter [Victivallaceae bacterium]
MVISDLVMSGVILLLVATISAMVFNRLKIPYTIGLVVVGIVLSAFCYRIKGFEHIQEIKLNRELIMYVLLPALIFEASVNIDTKMLLKNLLPTLTLAAPGLVISTIITGLIMNWTTPLGIGSAMLFGALISATDPVAVISLFEMIGAPRRLRILVDGESLFNDATAIVMFNIIKGILLSGVVLGMGTVVSGSIDFVVTFLGGLLVGAGIGFIMAQIILFAKDDPVIEVALSTIVAYTAFIAADKYFNVSGVMAAMGAGMVINYYGASRFSPEVKQYMKQFWSFVSFVANSFIFLLLGFTEEFYLIYPKNFGGLLEHIMWAVIAIQIARAVVVFGLVPLLNLNKKDAKISWQYQLVIFWGGLRGAVPLALVFSLPENLPHKELIIQVTLGVVLFTLLVQGTTISKILHVFKFDRPTNFIQFSKCYSLLLACKEGLARLNEITLAGYFAKTNMDEFKKEYTEKIQLQEDKLKNFNRETHIEHDAVTQALWGRVLSHERASYEYLYDCNFIPERIFRQLTFYVEQMLDNVVRTSKIPEKINRISLSMRIESIFFKLWSKIIPGKTLQSRYHAKTIAGDYLTLCCIEIGCRGILKEIALLREDVFFKDYPSIIDECEEHYNDLSRRAIALLQRLEASNVQLINVVERAAVRQIIYGAELSVIHQLNENGEINDQVAGELAESIIDCIASVRKKVYRQAEML